MIVNNEKEDWNLINGKGELLFKVRNGESIVIRSKSQTQNDKTLIPAKQVKGGFIKIMKNKKNQLFEKLRNYPTTFMALFKMLDYLNFESNFLIKDGRPYRCADLARDLGITRQSASEHIHRLEKENLLRVLQTDKGNVFVVNPNYIFEGKKVPVSVIKLFEK